MTDAVPHSRRLLWFTTPIIGVGAAILAYALWQLPSTANPVGWVVLGVLATGAATFAIKIPRVSAFISISDTFFFASVLLFGPAPATVSIALDSLLLSIRRGFRPQQLLFNTTSSAIALWSGAQVYSLLGGPDPLAVASGEAQETIFGPLAALAGVHFLLNTGMTMFVMALDKQLSVLRLWRDHFAIISLNYFAAASASFFLIVLIQYAGLTGFVAVVPLIVVCYLAMQSWLGRVEDAQRHVDKVNALYMSTIGAFSTAIEAKDGVTSDHVNRVQSYALGLAHALGVDDPLEIQALEAAAVLHDTGKLAVPEHILNKPGRLTPAELETMQAHVDVGADILSSIDFPYPVVPIVRAHHENWDGTGYPPGLRGEAIPLGARSLSVVDCYDALTSDRPYRSAMSEQDAIAIIVERRGKMYDPRIVDKFLEVYRDVVLRVDERPALQSAVRQIRRVHRPAAPKRPNSSVEGVGPDGSEELLAFVSLARLASGTAAISDVGVMAAGYLRQIAPGATVALMAADPARGTLTVQYASGPAAEQVTSVSMEAGQRISGWVAANWQPMLNAEARLDLLDLTGELRHAVAVPLITDSRLIGVLTIYATEPFADVQSRRVEMIAPHLAIALAQVEAPPARSQRDLRVVSRR
jgi:putative nucleotidyltransferase with HDIG domain